MEDVGEASLPGDLFQLRTRIGNGDEALADGLAPDRSCGLVAEIIHEHVRLERGARFARHDEDRAGKVDFRLHGRHLLRIGRIERFRKSQAIAIDCRNIAGSCADSPPRSSST